MASDTVLLEGHIIDSLILAKVLDTILMMGGTFDLSDLAIGSTRDEVSRVKVTVRAPTDDELREILQAIQPHGARLEHEQDCTFEPAPADGVLPEGFYATTHLPTQVRLNKQWLDVEGIEMDLAIRLEPEQRRARTVPMASVRQGAPVVTGRDGIRVFPPERPRERDVFGFMEAQVSSERPHQAMIADVARRMEAIRQARRSGAVGKPGEYGPEAKVLLAGGPAIVHGGGRDALTWLVEAGYIHVLFCGNALAAHDLEASFFGTSLGYALSAGRTVPHGHEHHLRTINRVRAIGGIRQAVESGVVTSGVMAACVRQGVQVVMAGTIRDDGPLPEVITDSVEAQNAMRAALPGVGLALLVASTLHAVGTGNLLPATVPTVCVDINPSVPVKLSDRGSFQALGLVMDAASFLRELARELGRKE